MMIFYRFEELTKIFIFLILLHFPVYYMSTKPHVLFCCLGNIIRSPLCEGIMRHKYGDRVFVDSAAVTDDDLGCHPQTNAKKIAKQHGFDISKHISRLVTEKDFQNFDLIVALERYVYTSLLKMKPSQCHAKVVEFAPKVDIINPWYESMERFEQMYNQIESHWPAFIKANLPELE